MSILITGGAGYIGSHAAHDLVARNENVVVLDNLCTGSSSFVPESAHFVNGSAGDRELVRRTMQQHHVTDVMHFAGLISVPESIAQPLNYYENNTDVSRALVETCVEMGVRNFIFSSTAAVYGQTEMFPVAEDAPKLPLNPYGRSKIMVEWMLEDVAHAHDFRCIALRYFNVAGVDSSRGAGQPGRQIAHLVKRAAQVALGRVDYLDIFGTDYPTADGTAVRDYIHVTDLIDAHRLALEYLRGGGVPGAFNCGYGTGASVLDVILAFENVTGRKLPVRYAARRAGDAAFVVADSRLLRRTLGWRPRFDCLADMVLSALEWERHLPS